MTDGAAARRPSSCCTDVLEGPTVLLTNVRLLHINTTAMNKPLKSIHAFQKLFCTQVNFPCYSKFHEVCSGAAHSSTDAAETGKGAIRQVRDCGSLGQCCLPSGRYGAIKVEQAVTWVFDVCVCIYTFLTKTRFCWINRLFPGSNK